MVTTEFLLEEALQAAETLAADRGIGRLQERTLHSTLKFWLQPDVGRHEVKVGHAVADIFDGEQVIEVQTAGVYPLKKKLACLLTLYPVTVVIPITHVKWLYWINPNTGEHEGGRRSPKKGQWWDALSELFWLSDFWETPRAHPLTVRLLMVDMEEYRLQDGWGRDGKRGSHRTDRRPLCITDERWVRSFADVADLLPPLPPTFTAAVFGKAIGRRTGRALGRALKFAEQSGAVEKTGKEGRAFVYTIK